VNNLLSSSRSPIRNAFRSRGNIFGLIMLLALLAFEAFNYSTTEFALNDVLGDLTFLGLRWATILSIAFCGIDFAGVARLFTPEQGRNEPTEVWYLFGAWVLAAAMNASLTWWGVAVAISTHVPQGSAILGREKVMELVPVFVAVMVWVVRILLIGSFSISGDRLFAAPQDDRPRQVVRPASPPLAREPYQPSYRPSSQPVAVAPSRQPQAPRPAAPGSRPAEPTYTRLVPDSGAEGPVTVHRGDGGL
jgi:hypothetical protein